MNKISVILFLFALSSQAATCPDASLGENQEDCPWAGIARTLSEQTAEGKVLEPKDLKDASPDLFAQISRDSKEQQFKLLWGQSINYDELAKGVIVDPAILKALAKTFRVQWISDRVAHAGMEHTYGYLFSNLKTAFGYKRARWVHGDTEHGFGLPAGTLGPTAPSAGGGTLFRNATYFFGKIAFRSEPAILNKLNRSSSGTAQALREFNFSSLRPIRLEETITAAHVVLRTDLVPFTIKSADAASGTNQYLLVYSAVVNGGAKLITGFPVDQGFVDNVLSKQNLGDDKPILTHYNAFIDGVSGTAFIGTRRVITSE